MAEPAHIAHAWAWERSGIRPVFVVGRHRSGTTWVTNILAAHRDVYTPEHAAHWGQHESAFFCSLAPYCRWGASEPDRVALQAIFERSDFYRLLFPATAPAIPPGSLDPGSYFRAVMDQAARLRGCRYWVEKTPAHSLLLDDLRAAFPDARFIAVRRSRLATIRSNVHQFGDPHALKDWAKAAVWGAVYDKVLRHHAAALCWVAYEDLQRDFAGEAGRLFAHIGLPGDSAEGSRWAPNTSHADRRPETALRYRMVAGAVAVLLAPLPPRVCNWLGRTWVRRRKGPLPRWLFRVYGGE